MAGRRRRLGRWGWLSLAALTCVGAVGLPVAAQAVGGQAAGEGQAARVHAAGTGHGKPQWARSNTGATHSPQVLAQFAGRAPIVIHGPEKTATTAIATTAASAPLGLDVASYQESQTGGINWSTIYNDGIRFVAIKATEGDYYTNPYALKDLPAAKNAKLATVAYAFAIPNGGSNGSTQYSASPVVQADDLVNYLTSNNVPVPTVMLDVEYDPYAGSDGTPSGSWCYGLSQSAMVSWIASFDNEIRAKTGRLPIIYTPPAWWSKCTGGSTNFGQTPVWVPYYSSTATSPPLPAGWSNWNFWQYGQGKVYGISGSTTDLDQLNPSIITLLNPGIQQDPAGSAIPILQITPFTVGSPAPALTYSSSTLPPGLAIDASGQISGTPTQVGSYQTTVNVTDSSGHPGSVSFTWDVSGSVSVTQPANQSTVAGTPVRLQLQATDSASGYTPSFTASGLPPGLSVSSSGLITGWPDQPGTYTTTVRAADSLGAASSATFTWTVSAAPDSGPAGPVRLDLDGKCLNDVGNSSKNGTALDIWTCNGSTSQHWTVVKDQTLRIHGKCLDVYQSRTTDGTRVQLYSCNGSAAEQWRVSTGGELVNPLSGKCLTDPSGKTANGTWVRIYSCAGKNYQKWTLPAGPVVSGIPGKCLDDSGNGTSNNNKIDIWNCSSTAGAQKWVAEPDQTVRIHGRCLTVYQSRTGSGTKVVLYGCNRSSGQNWSIAASGSGSKLVNPHSGLCLTVPGDSTTNGTGLVIRSCAGAIGQAWRVQ